MNTESVDDEDDDDEMSAYKINDLSLCEWFEPG